MGEAEFLGAVRSDEHPEEATGSKVERVRPGEILKGVDSVEPSRAEERRKREPRRSQTDGRAAGARRAAREEAPQEELSTPHAEEEEEWATDSTLDRRPREERGRRRNGEQEHPQAGEEGGQRQGQGNGEQDHPRNVGGQEAGRHRNVDQEHPRTEDAAEFGGSRAGGGDVFSQVAEGEEEGRKAKGMHAPRVVSKEEREEHERTHIPYRSWCRACVKGRGRGPSECQESAWISTS